MDTDLDAQKNLVVTFSLIFWSNTACRLDISPCSFFLLFSSFSIRARFSNYNTCKHSARRLFFNKHSCKFKHCRVPVQYVKCGPTGPGSLTISKK